jgi:NADH-quinone oxidoreductase subunit N
MGVMLSFFLFSLAGILPFVGFIGKYMVFAAAIDAGFIALAIVGVLASAASVYYYLRPMVYMYFRDAHKDVPLVQSGLVYRSTLIVLAIMTLYFGVAFGGLHDLLTSYYASDWVAHLMGS